MKLKEEQFLALCKQMYAKMSTEMDSEVQDFYTYEATLDKLITALGSVLLEGSLGGEEIKERRKKKSTPDLAS